MGEIRNILVAVDGSDQALEAVRFAGITFPPEKTHVLLYHVGSPVPEAFLDLRKDLEFRSSVVPISAWASQMKKNMEAFMDRSCESLKDSGFSQDAISVEIAKKNKGISRDILQKAKEGFSAAVIGRTGVSRIKDILMGSVAEKLVGVIKGLPLIVVGGNPSPGKILIAFDGSEGSWRAVNQVAALADPSRTEILISHVVRPMEIPYRSQTVFNSGHEAQWVDENTRAIIPKLVEAKNLLVNRGFSEERIVREVLENRYSRAATLAKEAVARGYGTIVLGRRGLTMVEEFLMGRVSRKVLQLAKERSVWIA
ncbi:MAG: universal stress protein [Desulfobacterales bacterium]|nr:universal stress protein [Desulfobacterales bacterium]